MIKKKLIFFILFIGFISNNLLAEERTAPAILKTVSSHKEIHRWLWKNSQDNTIYEFLRSTSNEIEFLSPDGKILVRYKYLPLSTIVTSEDQNFIAVIQDLTNDPQFELTADQKLFQYNVTSFTGELKYSIRVKAFYDDPIPGIYLTDNGEAILVDATIGTVKLYDSKGNLQTIIDLFEDDIAAYEKPIDCAVSTNGGVFAIVTQKRPINFNEHSSNFISGEPWIFCYSINGKKLWEIPLALATVSSVSISQNGKYVIVSHYTPEKYTSPILRSTVFSSNGQKVMEIPALVQYSQFMEEDNRLVFVDKENLFFVDLIKKEFQKRKICSKNEERIIAGLKLSESVKQPVLLISSPVFQDKKFIFVESELIEFNSLGEPIWKINLHDDKIIEPSFLIYKNKVVVGSQFNYKIYGGADEK